MAHIDGEDDGLEAGDFVAFPTLDRRMVKRDGQVTIYKLSEAKGFADV